MNKILFLNKSVPSSILYKIGSVLSFVIILIGLDSLYRHVFLGYIYNSDLVYIESIYRDLFTRHIPMDGWLVSRAPYFFPDWAVYFILRAFTGGYGSAWYLYVILDLIALIAFFYALVRLFFPSEKVKDLFYSLCWSTLLIPILKYAPDGCGKHTFLFPVYHSGAFLNGLLILLIWIKALYKPLKSPGLILLFLFSIISTMSDEWWILWFGLPIGITTLCLIFYKKIGLVKNLFFLTSLGAGVVIGEILSRAIALKKWLYFSQIAVGTPGETVAHQIEIIVRDILQLYASSPLLLCLFIATLILCFQTLISWRKKTSPTLPNFAEGQSVTFWALHLATIFIFLIPQIIIVHEKLWSQWNYRYIIPLFYLPWIIVGLHLLRLKKRRQAVAVIYTFPVLLGLSCVPFKPQPDLAKVFDVGVLSMSPLLTDAQCIDEVAKAHQVKFGASEYWHAKNITESSRAGVFVNQFTYNYDVLHWMNNLHWYFEPSGKGIKYIDYDFIIASIADPSWKNMLTKFGPPSEINLCGGLGVFLYKDEKKQKLNAVIKTHLRQFFTDKEGYSSIEDNFVVDPKRTIVELNSSDIQPISSPQASIIEAQKNSGSFDHEFKDFLRWTSAKNQDFSFLQRNFRNISDLENKNITLTFWARSIAGPKNFASQIYLLPHGLFDSSAVYVNPALDTTVTLTDKWKKFTVYFNSPSIPLQDLDKNASAVIRPLFFEKSEEPRIVDIASIQLVVDPVPAVSPEDIQTYSPFAKEDSISNLLKKADQFYSEKNYVEEFKILKKLELTLPSHTEALNLFASRNLNLPVNSSRTNSEIYWRLARVYTRLFETASPVEREGFIRIAADYALYSQFTDVNSDSIYWFSTLVLKLENYNAVGGKEAALRLIERLKKTQTSIKD